MPEKGVGTLVEATYHLGAGLLIAGSGPMEERLLQERHVCLLGALQRGEMDRFWRAIDVLVLPSLTTRHWAEQFGRVLVEAMGRGIPVVGSNSGAIPEVIGDAGLVVPEGSSAALAAALRQIRDDPALRATLVTGGLQRARQCYSQDVIMDQIVSFYRQVMESHAAA